MFCFFKYFPLNRIITQFFIRKDIFELTRDRKGISKFPQTVLRSLIIFTRVCLSHFEKILMAESRAQRRSKEANF